MRRLIALFVVIALVLGGVLAATWQRGDEAAGGLDDVEVAGGADERPTVRFDEPFETSEGGRRVITEGDGEEVGAESVVTFDYLVVDGRDGAELEASYDEGPITLDLGQARLLPALEDGLVGANVGSRVLVGIPPQEPARSAADQEAEEPGSVLFVIDVRDIRHPLERAEGAAVPPAEGLPTVTLDPAGAPTITVPDGPPPEDLVVQTLIEGDGPVVEAGQTLVAHYTGVVWGGAQFDSSWERGERATFPIGTGGVIDGWDEGLVGQKVGSQVLLVVPSAKGYPEGNPDAGIAPGDTIVFVVDILDAY